MTTAREAITEAYKAFEEAFYKGEADTISRMYTEDAELLLTPNKPSAYLRTTCEDCSRPTVSWRSLCPRPDSRLSSLNS